MCAIRCGNGVSPIVKGVLDREFFPDVARVFEDKPGRPDKARKLVVLERVRRRHMAFVVWCIPLCFGSYTVVSGCAESPGASRDVTGFHSHL